MKYTLREQQTCRYSERYFAGHVVIVKARAALELHLPVCRDHEDGLGLCMQSRRVALQPLGEAGMSRVAQQRQWPSTMSHKDGRLFH